MSVYRGAGGSGDATNDATVTAVQAAATSAATSATNAANSATAAANSASGAATSATNASNSATTAAGSVSTAAGHVSSASTFATNASLSATDAEDAATEAEGYASEAFDYKVAAASSASSASTSATNAAASSATATTAVNNALSLYGDAAALDAAVTAAQLAETNAETAETNAETAATTATNAASTATTQATNAAASAVAADADATAASIDANEAQAAATAAQAAVSSATAIYGSLEDIQQAEANSEANRDAAAASATSASNSASAASTSATNSATSASAAATSAAAASAVALGNEPVRHSVRPSLLLDFANTKTLDPRITYTRASTGTFYDGKTVAKAEENFFRYSQEFDNAYWTKTNVTVTANSDVAPDGTTTADTISATANDGRLLQTSSEVTVTSGLTYTISAWIRRKTGTGTVQFYCFQAPAGGFSGDLGITSTWARYTFTFTANSTGANTRLFQLGTSGDEVYVWGAQMEQRSSVTAYTATTTAAITNYIPALQTAAAGVARFEHNPTTGESLGLEIEEQRTNLILRSDGFDNASWTKTRSSLESNTIVAPDGTLTGDKLVEDTANGTHPAGQTAVVSSGTTATFSCYLKAAGRTWALLSATNVATTAAYFDLQNGVVGSSSGTNAPVSSAITSVGNGWYRCSMTYVSAGSTTYFIMPASSVPSSSYTGDGYSGIFIWGAQLETGAFATSYIPTVASQVTRSADSASMTGTNFSSWYRTDEGTLYSDGVTSATNYPFANISDGTSANSFEIVSSNTANFVFLGVVSGSLAFQMNGGVALNSKNAFALKTKDFAGSVSGNTVTTNTTATLPNSLSRINIGFSNSTTKYANGTIKKIAYYGKKLTNAELVALTTI